MARFFKKRDAARGLAPGSLVFIGEQRTDEVHIRLIDYDGQTLTDAELTELEVLTEIKDTPTVSWININGLHNTEQINVIGEALDLHPLLLEDVLNTGQRPKLEEFDGVLYIVLKMLRLVDDQQVSAEQLSVVVGPSFLLTFQERPGDVFEPVRNRIRGSKGRVRISGPDYLAYALLDTVVDNYIELIEGLGSKVEDLEVEVLSKADVSILSKINDLKREMNFVRKSVRPARDAFLQLAKLDNDLIRPQTYPFLKDLLDITSHATEAIDTYREMLSDELNVYNSMVSNKLNDVMKVLTIFSALFIPLTFIAGIYGTNFENVPELKYEYSYFIFWGVMVAIAAAMFAFFKRRGWL